MEREFGDLLEQFRIIGGFACNCECAPQGIAPQPLMLGGGTLVKGNMCGDIDLILTQFLGNVKIDASDISYEVVALASQQGYITITPTEGTCSKTFTISIDFAAAIAAAAITVCIDDTAFVTPCGDDATGELGNFLLPFATIKAAVASTTSNSGHHVHVYPGTYAEAIINVGSDAVEKTGLNYYFEPGVTINSTGNTFTFNAIGTTIVRGAGILNASSNVFQVNAVTTLDIECLSLNNTGASGSCVFMQGGGTFRFKGSSMTATGNGCFDVRTVSSTGYVECDLFDNQTSALSSPCIKFNTGGTHGWIFYVKELKTMSNATNNGAGILVENSTAKVYFTGNVFQNVVAAVGYTAGIAVNSGILIFEGDVTTVTGHAGLIVGGQLVIKNSTLRAGGDACALASLNPPGTGLVIGSSSMFVNNSGGQFTISHQSSAVGSMQLTSCLISNESAAALSGVVLLNNAAQAIRLNNCNLYSAAAAGISIRADVAVDTRLVNCWSNVAVGGVGVITNLVQAINVDAQILQTIY